MDLTTKLLLAMCIQAIVGVCVSFFVYETVGLVMILLAAIVNVLIAIFWMGKAYKSETTKKEI